MIISRLIILHSVPFNVPPARGGETKIDGTSSIPLGHCFAVYKSLLRLQCWAMGEKFSSLASSFLGASLHTFLPNVPRILSPSQVEATMRRFP